MAKTEEGDQDRAALELPTELLRTLFCRECFPAREDAEGLSLGLSSNGLFGVDPKDAKLAPPSPPMPGVNGGNGDEEAVGANGVSSASCLETGRALLAAEWRRRKEMQSRSRMETKSENQGSLHGVSGVGIWGLGSHSAGAGGGSGNDVSGEAQGHANNQPSPEPDEKEVEIAGVGRVSLATAKELMRKVFAGMHSVSAVDEGPNGEIVEGFLYKYEKWDEVIIVCVCHGRFFSPAEFVRHAGGGEVANPMRRIIVKKCLS